MGDTYRIRPVSSSCDGIPGDTQEECEEHRSKTFVLMSHFGSFGLCLWHISEKVCRTIFFLLKVTNFWYCNNGYLDLAFSLRPFRFQVYHSP